MTAPMTTTTTPTRPRSSLPVSPAWVEHGFSRREREQWHAAGWTDPDQAARWHRALPEAEPAELFAMSHGVHRPDQVAQTARFVRSHLAAWTEAVQESQEGRRDVTDGRHGVDEGVLELG